MKKNKIVALLSTLCAGGCAFGLAACGDFGGSGEVNWNNALNFTVSSNFTLTVSQTVSDSETGIAMTNSSVVLRDGDKVK
ncbi:MAG: hypothetical protein ACI4MC_00810, partial [Candidatus Coproplasma sp.]